MTAEREKWAEIEAFLDEHTTEDDYSMDVSESVADLAEGRYGIVWMDDLNRSWVLGAKTKMEVAQHIAAQYLTDENEWINTIVDFHTMEESTADHGVRLSLQYQGVTYTHQNIQWKD